MENLIPEPVHAISEPSPANVVEVAATDVRYLASYTWTNAQEPTMVVPGSPRVWRNLALPYTVPLDTGETFGYWNGLKIPHSPMLPIFRAIDVMEEDNSREKLDWPSVDFITCRNNLRKLLSWIVCKDKGEVVDDFRIDLKLCGVGTVLMQRWETHVVFDTETAGFGYSFGRESTRAGPDCDRGIIAGHSRVISYNFHGMKMLVRSEVDACVFPDGMSPSSTAVPISTAPVPPVESYNPAASSENELVDALASLSVTSSTPSSNLKKLTVVKGGAEVPQSSLIKIKTRSTRNAETFDWTWTYLQLFLGQTYNLYLGVHQKGNFQEVRQIDFDSPSMKEAAKVAQPVLKKLARLLDEILYTALDHGEDGRLSLVSRAGELKMYRRREKESFLPDEILDRFCF
ncbi:hypothetical protein BDW22DRAFT_880222 [Trametopsis cervina]|nr:hypothetical protein BDW22DRAFT_880222 [Trametopsis cervina]